jgi:hypothetical protein
MCSGELAHLMVTYGLGFTLIINPSFSLFPNTKFRTTQVIKSEELAHLMDNFRASHTESYRRPHRPRGRCSRPYVLKLIVPNAKTNVK